MCDYKIEIEVEYDEKPQKFIIIKTEEPKNNVCDNVLKATMVLNESVWNEYDSYEEYKEDYPESFISEEEFKTMEMCFNGYNEITLISYLSKKYGYTVEPVESICDLKVVIS